MRILVLSNLYPPDVIGGYELGCRQVVDALRARGHTVRVLTSAPRTPLPHVPHVRRTMKLTDIFNDYTTNRLVPVSFHLNVAESNFINAYNVHSLLRELDEFQPDVAYAWMLLGVGGLGLMGCLNHLRVPWVWHLMDSVPLILCQYFGHTFQALAREFDRQFRGHYLACSRRVVDEIESGGVKLNGEVEVVPNWVVGDRPPARASYYRRGEPLRIVTAGQVSQHKGVDLLIQAAGLLRDRGYDAFSVDIYGHNNEPYFPSLVQRLDLTDKVTFRGNRTQDELAGLYGQYDLFAFPTWEREPFGFAPLEAAAHGCVPVMSQSCGIAEWLVHGVHCLKSERSAGSFADAFQEVLDGAIDLEPIGRRAEAVVHRDFHIDAQIPRIERTLERASAWPRTGAGTAAEAYRLALLAERLTQVLIHETFAA